MPQILERASESEPFMQTPNRKRWTRKDCEFLVNSGLLTERYELIDGEVISKMGQKPPHATFLNFIAKFLTAFFGADYIRSQQPIDLKGQERVINEPEPDIVVVDKSDITFLERHPLPEEVVLLVEVADSSLFFDLRVKAPLYAKSGVSEYWVADVKGRRIIVHRSPSPTGYLEVVSYSENESLSPLSRPESSIAISDLIPPSSSSSV